MNKKSTLIGGTLLVAGTSIGGGMLALPVWTSIAGFFPSCSVYLFCWMFMVSTALLFVEVSHWLSPGANIISMAQRTLGTPGKIFSWCMYLFLFYCLSVAYIVGCGDLVMQASGGLISDKNGSILAVMAIAPLIFCGIKLVSRINIFLMAGLGISFFTFIVLGIQFVKTENLLYHNWSHSLVALPIAFTAFAFQGTVPTLIEFMNHDIKRIRIAIIAGSAITFVTYLIWQWLIQGIIPAEGPGGLIEALSKDQNAVQPLKNFIDMPIVYGIGQAFAFFALVTSFFGVALGLLDFLADGLSIEKNVRGKIILCCLLFIPPLAIAYTHPNIFLLALDYAGGYGCALLLGLLPIAMVWSGRYRLGLKAPYALPGGRITLLVMLLFVLFELFCQVQQTLT